VWDRLPRDHFAWFVIAAVASVKQRERGERRTHSRRFRNTEIFGFDGDRISRVEVHVGWDIP
jgi:hypothetical protein